MKKSIVTLLLLMPLIIVISVNAKSPKKNKEIKRCDIVAEYIRSLSAVYNIEKSMLSEVETSRGDTSHRQKPINPIRDYSKIKLELGATLAMLKGIRLESPFDLLIPNTVYIYKEKIKLLEEVTRISEQFSSYKPKTNTDHITLVKRLFEIKTRINNLDENLYKMMPMVFALLLDEKADGVNNMSHLNITQEEREMLITNIDNGFGDSLEKVKDNWGVASAVVLKANLLQDYLSMEAWQKTGKK